MKAFTSQIRNFLTSEDGPTAVEYAVMLALILVVCITAVTAIGTRMANTQFEVVRDAFLDLIQAPSRRRDQRTR